MFVLDNNMFGVIVEKNYLSNFKEEDRKFIDIYLKICQAIIEKDINTLNDVLPEKISNQIKGTYKSKEQCINEIKQEIIKYYSIEILKIEIEYFEKNKVNIKSTNKIRAKLYDYNGGWTVDSYLILEKDENNWKSKEILI